MAVVWEQLMGRGLRCESSDEQRVREVAKVSTFGGHSGVGSGTRSEGDNSAYVHDNGDAMST